MHDAQSPETGIVIIDHGSRREESNDMLLHVVDMYRKTAPFRIVEPAHMELAEPTLQQAFDRCVEQGAKRVVVMPYFLLPGRHWDQDIPRMAAEAAASHPGVAFQVTAPLGLSPLICQVIQARVDESLAQSAAP